MYDNEDNSQQDRKDAAARESVEIMVQEYLNTVPSFITTSTTESIKDYVLDFSKTLIHYYAGKGYISTQTEVSMKMKISEIETAKTYVPAIEAALAKYQENATTNPKISADLAKYAKYLTAVTTDCNDHIIEEPDYEALAIETADKIQKNMENEKKLNEMEAIKKDLNELLQNIDNLTNDLYNLLAEALSGVMSREFAVMRILPMRFLGLKLKDMKKNEHEVYLNMTETGRNNQFQLLTMFFGVMKITEVVTKTSSFEYTNITLKNDIQEYNWLNESLKVTAQATAFALNKPSSKLRIDPNRFKICNRKNISNRGYSGFIYNVKNKTLVKKAQIMNNDIDNKLVILIGRLYQMSIRDDYVVAHLFAEHCIIVE